MKEGVKNHVLPARRSEPRTGQRRPRRPARPDGRPDLADGLRGHDRDDGERLHQHEEPVAHDHRRGRGPGRGRRRRDPLPGRPVRRLEPVPEGRQADVHLQLPGHGTLHRRGHRRRCRPGRRRSVSNSPTTAASRARAGRARSSSTARRSPKVESTARRALSFSADEGADVGVDGGTPVTDDYKERDNKFTGKISKVTVELN